MISRKKSLKFMFLELCGSCVGQVIPAIMECGLDIGCVAPKSGSCLGCICKVVADLAIKFLHPICDAMING